MALLEADLHPLQAGAPTISKPPEQEEPDVAEEEVTGGHAGGDQQPTSAEAPPAGNAAMPPPSSPPSRSDDEPPYMPMVVDPIDGTVDLSLVHSKPPKGATSCWGREASEDVPLTTRKLYVRTSERLLATLPMLRMTRPLLPDAVEFCSDCRVGR